MLICMPSWFIIVYTNSGETERGRHDVEQESAGELLILGVEA